MKTLPQLNAKRTLKITSYAVFDSKLSGSNVHNLATIGSFFTGSNAFVSLIASLSSLDNGLFTMVPVL